VEPLPAASVVKHPIRKLIVWLMLGLTWAGLGALAAGTSSHALLVGNAEFYGWDAAWRTGLFFGAVWVVGTVVIGVVGGLLSWASESDDHDV
jgi:hypothetical protein